VHARLVLGLCERFGCLPSQLLEEDGELARWLTLEALAGPDPEPDYEGW
jgi:hypothetical protein